MIEKHWYLAVMFSSSNMTDFTFTTLMRNHSFHILHEVRIAKYHSQLPSARSNMNGVPVSFSHGEKPKFSKRDRGEAFVFEHVLNCVSQINLLWHPVN